MNIYRFACALNPRVTFFFLLCVLFFPVEFLFDFHGHNLLYNFKLQKITVDIKAVIASMVSNWQSKNHIKLDLNLSLDSFLYFIFCRCFSLDIELFLTLARFYLAMNNVLDSYFYLIEDKPEKPTSPHPAARFFPCVLNV